MSKPNILDFKTPTGQSGNLLSPSSWIQLILGSMVLIFAFGMGQKVAGAVSNRVPVFPAKAQDPFVHPMAAPVKGDQFRVV